MKITIDIDCTPKEARTFLGLPDVEPLQDLFMEQMKDKMVNGLNPDDMEKMMNMWLVPGMNMASTMTGQGLEAMQKMFWNAAMGGTNEPEK